MNRNRMSGASSRTSRRGGPRRSGASACPPAGAWPRSSPTTPSPAPTAASGSGRCEGSGLYLRQALETAGEGAAAQGEALRAAAQRDEARGRGGRGRRATRSTSRSSRWAVTSPAARSRTTRSVRGPARARGRAAPRRPELPGPARRGRRLSAAAGEAERYAARPEVSHVDRVGRLRPAGHEERLHRTRGQRGEGDAPLHAHPRSTYGARDPSPLRPHETGRRPPCPRGSREGRDRALRASRRACPCGPPAAGGGAAAIPGRAVPPRSSASGMIVPEKRPRTVAPRPARSAPVDDEVACTGPTRAARGKASRRRRAREERRTWSISTSKS